MNSQRSPRSTQATTAVLGLTLVAAAVAGCNDRSVVAVTPGATASASGSSRSVRTPVVPTVTQTGTDAAEHARIRAARDAHKPPKDLTWLAPPTPKSWTKVREQSDGWKQWHVTPGCNIDLWQFSKVHKDPRAKNSRGLVTMTAENYSVVFPGKPKPVYRHRGTVKVVGFVTGIPDIRKVTMAEAIVDYGKARAEIIGYRDGDWAISYTSYCPTVASFKKVSASDFNAFRDKLAEQTTY